jgi:hypothetical protein
MPDFVDLKRKKFGQLTVLRRATNSVANVMRYQVRCSCGQESIVQAGNLRTGHAISCRKCGHLVASMKRRTHGLRDHPVYAVWNVMRQRCQNPRNKQYDDYGGRGIRVATEWNKFRDFWRDMGPSYQAGLTLDRINNDGPYSASNCRWTTMAVQNRNTRRTRHADSHVEPQLFTF